MAPRLAAVAILEALVRFCGATSDGVSAQDVTYARAQCESLLSDVSTSRYSVDELAIICRARLPGPVCRDAASQLGPTPWSPVTVGATCKTWTERWQERGLSQGELDTLIATKAAAARGKECTSDAVDECAAYKRMTVPKYSTEIDDMLADKRSGGWSASESKYIATERQDLAGGVARVHIIGAAVGFGVLGALVALFTMWRTRRARSSLSASGMGDDTDVREMLNY